MRRAAVIGERRGFRACGFAIAIATALLLWPASAQADLLFEPFLSWTHNTDRSRWVTGGGMDVEWSRGWFIAGGDIGYAGGFFDPAQDATDLIESSHVMTISGHAGIGLPKTRDNRFLPYATAGWGVLRQKARDREGLIDVSRNDPSFNIGGGVRALFTSYLGVRAEMRYFRSMKDPFESPDPIVADIKRLGFWRFSVGAIVRIAP
jgi:opacity protein-like surface antigen